MFTTRSLVAVTWVMLLVGTGFSQTAAEFVVTSVAPAGGATSVDPNGVTASLLSRSEPAHGRIEVARGANLMLFRSPDVVAVFIGPATAEIPMAAPSAFVLRSGRVLLRASVGDRLAPVRISALITEQPPAQVDLTLRRGTVCLARTSDGTELAYLADPGSPPIQIGVGKSPVEVPANHLLIVDPTGRLSAPVALPDGWLVEHGFDDTATRAHLAALGVASARESRETVADSLFTNIVLWDRYANTSHVAPMLEPRPFNPEDRQVLQTATGTVTQSARAGPPPVQAINAANEVPLLSPAAAEVLNIGAGVTAVTLNAQAARLLQQTGSQGLGFRGPALLTIPGFIGGQRTVGPPGLGGTRP